eukprot:6896087-Lingulodinium_polyedra.AAC.1
MIPEQHFGALQAMLGGLGFDTAALAGICNIWRNRNIRSAGDLALYIRRIGPEQDRARIDPGSEYWGYAARIHAWYYIPGHIQDFLSEELLIGQH